MSVDYSRANLRHRSPKPSCLPSLNLSLKHIENCLTVPCKLLLVPYCIWAAMQGLHARFPARHSFGRLWGQHWARNIKQIIKQHGTKPQITQHKCWRSFMRTLVRFQRESWVTSFSNFTLRPCAYTFLTKLVPKSSWSILLQDTMRFRWAGNSGRNTYSQAWSDITNPAPPTLPSWWGGGGGGGEDRKRGVGQRSFQLNCIQRECKQQNNGDSTLYQRW